VVGPELAAARTRLALTVDQLAERTRIRPHVIESIEVDDFAPCGGDFYARGHLRTLARVLGVDAAPLLSAYDERYADAPIDARRVFEAELATGVDGPIRSTRGGPNWSVLVAAVMAIVLAWSIARLIMDSPVELHAKPVLNGSPSSATKLGPPVPVVLDAAAGGAHVVVRDGAGDVVFNGDLAYGESRTVKASPPVRVQSSDGALRVDVDGQDRGPLGADGQPAQNTFAAAE
jgi:cytoskeleton protein RodZ